MVRMNPEQFEHDHEPREQQETVEEQEILHAACTAELDSCRQELVLMKDRLQRVTADFDNFKKRVEKDRLSWSNTLEAEFIKELLPVIDDFDRALAESHKQGVAAAELACITGFELIAKGLNKFLATHHVVEISNLKTFDPVYHEAVAMVTSADHKQGEIVAVLQKGYLYKENVLRPAKVTVAS